MNRHIKVEFIGRQDNGREAVVRLDSSTVYMDEWPTNVDEWIEYARNAGTRFDETETRNSGVFVGQYSSLGVPLVRTQGAENTNTATIEHYSKVLEIYRKINSDLEQNDQYNDENVHLSCLLSALFFHDDFPSDLNDYFLARWTYNNSASGTGSPVRLSCSREVNVSWVGNEVNISFS